MSNRVSTRSNRCSSADSVSLADGNSSRAHTTSSSKRGAVAPRISPTGVHHLGVTGQRPGTECGRPDRASVPARRRARRHRGRRRRHRLQHDQIAEAFQQIGGEPPRVVVASMTASTAPNNAGVSGGQRVDGVVDQRHIGRTEQRQRPRYATGLPSAPASSWSSTESVSRGEPPPARMTSG